MENKEREDLLSELAVIETMVRENPCGLKSIMFCISFSLSSSRAVSGIPQAIANSCTN